MVFIITLMKIRYKAKLIIFEKKDIFKMIFKKFCKISKLHKMLYELTHI